MILDSSALIAILRDEPEAAACARAIESSTARRVSAANFVEAAIIIDASRHPVASRRFDDLVEEAHIIIEPVTAAQARIAREAYRDFGKGSGHPAQLNFGDCLAYALAKVMREPLLFKGDDLAHTDIAPALLARGSIEAEVENTSRGARWGIVKRCAPKVSRAAARRYHPLVDSGE
jgi:ribonuclease VapC